MKITSRLNKIKTTVMLFRILKHYFLSMQALFMQPFFSKAIFTFSYCISLTIIFLKLTKYNLILKLIKISKDQLKNSLLLNFFQGRSVLKLGVLPLTPYFYNLFYYPGLLMEKTFHIPKIKRVELMNKVMIDPADLRKGIPSSTLPQLTDQGMILSLTPHKAPLAKLTPDGTLKLSLKYTAEVVQLLGKYIEVKVIDSYDDVWIGSFFGINVRGRGGEGEVRGCRVNEINGQTIIAEAVAKGGNQLWGKLQKKIEQVLSVPQ